MAVKKTDTTAVSTTAAKAPRAKKEIVAGSDNVQLIALQLRKKQLEIRERELAISNEANDLMLAIKNFDEDLNFGLKEKELQMEENKRALDVSFDEYSAEVAEQKSALDKSLEDYKLQLENTKLQLSRDLEAVQYDNNIAVRDNKLTTAETIAKAYNKIVVGKDDYTNAVTELAALKTDYDANLKAEVAKTTNAISSNIKATYETQLSEAKMEQRIIAEKAKMLEEKIAELSLTIKEQSTQIREFPGQIAKAVEAARTPVNVTSSK